MMEEYCSQGSKTLSGCTDCPTDHYCVNGTAFRCEIGTCSTEGEVFCSLCRPTIKCLAPTLNMNITTNESLREESPADNFIKILLNQTRSSSESNNKSDSTLIWASVLFGLFVFFTILVISFICYLRRRSKRIKEAKIQQEIRIFNSPGIHDDRSFSDSKTFVTMKTYAQPRNHEQRVAESPHVGSMAPPLPKKLRK